MKYITTIYRETSATTMSDYTESGSFDFSICREEISQSAINLVISEARGSDAIPPLFDVRTVGTLIHSLYNVYRKIVRTSQFPFKMEESKSDSSIQERFADKSRKLSPNNFAKHLYQSLKEDYIQATTIRFQNWRSPIMNLLMTLSGIYSIIQNV